MKKIILATLCGLSFMACQPKYDGYTIRGDMKGNSDGMKVMLQNIAVYPPVNTDSAVIQKGKFLLKGKVAQPGMYKLIIEKTADGDQFNWLASRFYLENSDISFKGHVDSLKTFFWSDETFRKDPVITGSATQDLYQQYQKETATVNKKYGTLNEKYLEVYHRPAIDGIFNTTEGVRLAKEMDQLSKERDILRWKFIEKHPGSIVGYDQAKELLSGMYINLTVQQIDRLTDLITQAWAGKPEMTAPFKEAAEKARPIALGQKYQNIELINPEGKMIKLSEYVPQGKYVMLEFWASWCGPCRAEIPHLKHVYKNYKNKGFEIVSISIDQNKADWDKAMKEEGMAWKQLCDHGGFEGPVTQKYKLIGVPTCILLDKEGRIFKTGMRGANLDAVLEDLYGKPNK